MPDISGYIHFNSFQNKDSLFYCHFLFETLSTYIPVVRVFKNVKFFNKWNLNAWHGLRMSKSIYFQALGRCG